LRFLQVGSRCVHHEQNSGEAGKYDLDEPVAHGVNLIMPPRVRAIESITKNI
jgi:hypothetical protein